MLALLRKKPAAFGKQHSIVGSTRYVEDLYTILNHNFGDRARVRGVIL